MVRLTVLPASWTPVGRGTPGRGSPGEGSGVVGDERLDEGTRNPLLGIGKESLLGPGVATRALVLLRFLGAGNAGSAVVGGPSDGREGRGKVAAMTYKARPTLIFVGTAPTARLWLRGRFPLCKPPRQWSHEILCRSSRALRTEDVTIGSLAVVGTPLGRSDAMQ